MNADLIEFFIGAKAIETQIIDDQLTIHVPRDLTAGGANLVLESSTDLHTWTSNEATFAGYSDPSDSAVMMIWTLPYSTETRFTRLRIDAAAP